MFPRAILATAAVLALSCPALAQPPDPKPEPKVDPKTGAPAAEPVAVPVSQPAPEFAPVDPRYSFRYDGGNGVGYRNGFFLLESFYPFAQVPGQSVGFGNARVFNYMDGRFWEVQLGGGSRWVVGESGAVFGVNAFYDGRNTDLRWYNQIGFGAELIGERWDLRANVYIPVGRQLVRAGSSDALSTPRFVGTNIAFDRTRFTTFESTMGGVDVEVGRRLPSFLPNVRSTAYLGFYHFSNDRVQTANGIRGRLEAWVNDNLSLHMAVQQDAVFDTTFTGGVAVHFGGGRRGSVGYGVESRLGAPVSRQPAMVIQRKTDAARTTELALDPATGAPIEVRHANSASATGGDGSVERPFNTLGTLQAGSAPGHILFVHANSAFTGEGIVLQDNQRLLGEGIAHQFVSRQGTFVLPRATAGTMAPLISMAPMTAVTLANGTEVSGLRIDMSGGDGIRSIRVSNVNVNRNFITGSGQGGIVLLRTGGTSRITENVLDNNNLARLAVLGIGVTNVDVPGTFFVTGNRVTNMFATSGIQVSAGANTFASQGPVVAVLNNNFVSGITGLGGAISGRGITLSASGDAVAFYSASNNTIGATFSDGLFVRAATTSTLASRLLGNTASGAINLSTTQTGTVFTENVLGTNSPAPMLMGNVTVVPSGTFAFPTP